jgi:hypothetical protein
MLIFLVPIVIGLLAIMLGAIGDAFRTGKSGTKFSRWCYRYDSAWAVTTYFSFLMPAIMLAGLICNHIDLASFPAKYKAVTMTLAESRGTGYSNIERAAITHKIIDMNKEIASIKYWNGSTWVGWFFPDRVANLELIK